MPGPVQTRTELLVIQATPCCNVNCRYCYLSLTHNASLLERIARLRERGKWAFVDEVCSGNTAWPARSDGDDDGGEDDDGGWNKY
jgi:hypothetical protein